MTPGPQAQYVSQMVTAKGVDSNDRPINLTTQFQVGQPVSLIVTVHGVTFDQSHSIAVRWLLNGALAPVAGALSRMIVTNNGPAVFSMTYPQPGTGMAMVYWDEPVSDNSDTAQEQFLAQTVEFTIQ